ncbi:amidase [Caldilinea sp.]|uniref:amidase n=1 Tax=Caldilinea sp. TaxID=2293560 RepID=UPI002C6ED6E3|nr:amidase [Caldilinea sp.]
MTSDDILFAEISTIAARYRDHSLSPVKVTELALARIEALNPVLNAFITVTAESALASAQRAADELRAGNDRGLLHGIPIALKDLIDTAGVRTTCGARILADHTPIADAAIVRHLHHAGAVIVGKTNLLEFAYGIVHPDFGPTWNPWDASRTAGGSSGGSAAAVAAGMCYAAVGTDTGGSIRIPAAYCGVAGFKPTYGRVKLEGVFPLSWSLDHAGPIARTSADAALLFDALLNRTPRPLRALDLRGLRVVALVSHHGGGDMQEAAMEAFEDACISLHRAGAQVASVSIPNLDLAESALFSILGPEASAIHSRWIKERPQDYAPFTRLQIELGFTVPALAHVRAQQYRRYLTGQMLDLLADADAILSPTAPWVAPRKDPAITEEAGAAEGRRTGLYNLTGLPALTVNSGFGPGDLPLGLQIVTRPGADRLALAIGAAFEALRPDVIRKPPL